MKRLPIALTVLLLSGCGAAATSTTTSTSTSASSSPTHQPSATVGLPDDFPLADGWPDESMAEPGPRYGLRGPNRELEPLDLRACDPLPDSAATDRLTALWTNVEDYRAREVTTYDGSPAAADRLDDLVAAFRSCPAEDEGSDGYTMLTEVRPVDAGDEAWVVVRRYEYDSAPAVGLQVTLLIHRGSGVLVDTSSNEGGAGPHVEQTITDQVQDQLDALTAPLDALK